jgi:hypothetical protein
MKTFKPILFSTFEATVFYVLSWYFMSVNHLHNVAFWSVFVVVASVFTFILHRRQHYWMQIYDEQWCPRNRWWFSPEKNYTIYDAWVGTIKEAERICRERTQQELAEVS